MVVEFLVSTMNRTDISFIENIFQNIKSEKYLVKILNQCTTILPQEIKTPKNVQIFSVKEKGLSKSRNRLLKLAEGDVCLFCDDDLVYLPDCIKIIKDAHQKYSNFGIVSFKAKNETGDDFRNYSDREKKHNLKTAFGTINIEITFKRDNILAKNIGFDESFGLGSQFPTAEDSIFLFDSIKNKVNAIYYPQAIVQHPALSSGIDYKNNELVYAKGAAITRLFGKKASLPLLFYFSFRQIKYYRNFYSYFRFCKLLNCGRRKYIRKAKINEKNVGDNT